MRNPSLCSCTSTRSDYTHFMESRERVQLHEHCIVPYRVTDLGVEFCLVTPVSESRWEFPKIAVNGNQGQREPLLEQAASDVGLHGVVQDAEPLGQFVARRGDQARNVTAFLMQVTHVEDSWPQQDSHRRLWCLAEEVRVRIRRKPLRHLIDVALRLIEAKPLTLATLNGNGHSQPTSPAATHS